MKEILTPTLRWSDRSVSGSLGNRRVNQNKYAAAIRAVIESAVVTWIGIVLCEIGLLAPTGHITVRANLFYWLMGRH